MTKCICADEDCRVPITSPLSAATNMLIAQAWADLRVVLAKSHPHHDPSTTEQYCDLHDVIHQTLADATRYIDLSAIGALTADMMYRAHEITLHDLLYAVTQARDRLRRRK
jgi:hypothetical protein